MHFNNYHTRKILKSSHYPPQARLRYQASITDHFIVINDDVGFVMAGEDNSGPYYDQGMRTHKPRLALQLEINVMSKTVNKVPI